MVVVSCGVLPLTKYPSARITSNLIGWTAYLIYLRQHVNTVSSICTLTTHQVTIILHDNISFSPRTDLKADLSA
jgi:hypothetical protein